MSESLKAWELRIGNWINLSKDNRTTWAPYQIDSGYEIYKLDESDCIDASPIPLDESWLVRMGARKTATGRGMRGLYEIGSMAFYYDLADKQAQINPCMECGGTWVDIKYAHQLQNLYYCLTGSELEISPHP